MARITVSHYLNKRLKPEKDGQNLYYPLYFSITVKSKNIRKRSNIDFPISEQEFETNIDKYPEFLTKLEYEKALLTRIVTKYIDDIKKNDVKKNLILFFPGKSYSSKDEFINSLNAYIDYYSYSIFMTVAGYCDEVIENKIYEKLKECFKLTDLEHSKAAFEYKQPFTQEVDIIYKNLSNSEVELLVLRERLRSFLAPYSKKYGYDIPLIDWEDYKIQPEFKEFLLTYHRKNEYYLREGFQITTSLVDKYIRLIDGIIKSEKYFELAQKQFF